ncbi:hypothetical protein L0Y41_01855 [bacterium]|nr:hypothetical protein [bacterium]
MIKLSSGHVLEYVAGSASLGFDGRGWWWQKPLIRAGLLDITKMTVITKSLTEPGRQGNYRWYNPFRAFRFIPDGTLNAIALSNPGLSWWCEKIGPTISRKKHPVIVSIHDENPEKLGLMASRLNKFDIAGVEIDAYCPNTHETIVLGHEYVQNCIDSCVAVLRNTRHPVLVKIYADENAHKIISSLPSQIEAVTFNTVRWDDLFPDKKSPLERFGGGGVSGKAAQKRTWKILQHSANCRECGRMPVIAPYIWGKEDIARARDLGIGAYSMCGLFFKPPFFLPSMRIWQDKKFKQKLHKKGLL